MSVDEIRSAFLGRFEGETRLEKFLAQRKERLAKAIGEEPWLMLSATPLFLREEIIDPRDEGVKHLLSSTPREDKVPFTVHCGWPSPILWGLRAEQNSGEGVQEYLEVHRIGHLEFGSAEAISPAPTGSGNMLASGVVVGYTDSFVRLFAALCEHAKVATPCAFGLTIRNADGLLLATGKMFSTQARHWPENVLDLPLTYVDDLSRESALVVKRINDRLWNAFGHDGCPFMDGTGQIRD